jgi:LPXTG-motif cell wall-anchored protein
VLTEANSGPVAASSTNWLVPALIGAGALIGAFLFLRRRRKPVVAQDELLFEPTPAPLPSQPVPTSALPLVAPPPAPPVTEVASSNAVVAEPLTIATQFTARAVRLSLVYATVQYELAIANTGTADLPALQIRADLASAHASLGTREQLAPAPEQLEAKHEHSALAPGETAVLKGEVRVPLQHVRTVTKGAAQFFVPLVRFAILTPDGTGLRRVYTIGPRDAGSGTIASVRLDAGPRNLRDLDAREIEAARGFALDPEIAHS